MRIFVDTNNRSEDGEIMDDFSIDGPVLHDTLNKLASINRWLGGNKVTMDGLKYLLKEQPEKQNYRIIDIGCGGGDILREIADFGRRKNLIFKLVGIDANEETVRYARQISSTYPEISYEHCDIFSKEFRAMNYDIVLSTLFLHHFGDQELSELINQMINKATMGIIINDLHRNILAYYLFKFLCLFISNTMVKEDGLTSVLRGFKKHELEKLAERNRLLSKIKWKWAFRYQWIIKKNT